jgi:hypothetical protein
MTWFNSIINTLVAWGVPGVSASSTGDAVAEAMSKFTFPDVNAAIAPLQAQIDELRKQKETPAQAFDQIAFLQSVNQAITDSIVANNAVLTAQFESQIKGISTALATLGLGSTPTPPADPSAATIPVPQNKTGVVKMSSKDLQTADAGVVQELAWLN